MVEKQYERMLVSTRKDLKEAYRQREELERKIAKLRQMVVTLGAMCGDVDGLRGFKEFVPRSGKLTDAVLNTIIASALPLNASDVRDILEDLGYRFQTANPLGSIHSVMNRLFEQKQIERVFRAKVLGPLGREPKYWYGAWPPPEPWTLASELVFDKEKRVFMKKEKSEKPEKVAG